MSEKDKKRKYLLFKKDDGRPDHLKPCAFFNSPAGCKNGSKCRFLHGAEPEDKSDRMHESDTSDTASEMSSEAPSVAAPEPPPPTMNAIKIDHKKRRTNDPGDEAAYPLLRVPSAEDEITLLKDQMATQQRLFEEQLKMLSNQISIQSLKSKSSESLLNSHLRSIPVREPAHKGKRALEPVISETESSDDEKFLFSTVNQILENGRNDNGPGSNTKRTPKSADKAKHAQAAAAAQQQQQQQAAFQPKTVSSSSVPSATNNNNNNNASNPFSMNPIYSFPNSFQAVGGFTPGSAPNNNNNSNNNIRSRVLSSAPVNLPTTHGNMNNAGSVPPGFTNMNANNNNSALNRNAPTFQIDASFTALSQQQQQQQQQQSQVSMKSPDSASAKGRKNIFAKSKQQSTTTTAGGNMTPKLDFKSLDYKHFNWEELVAKTQSHARYKMDYSLNVDASWVSARMGLKPEYPVIALDCEMCETEDPVTQVRESTLIRLSVINGQNPEEVLMDTLVAPSDPVIDLRTRIHGVTEEQLSGVKTTLRQVQAVLLKMITDQTIILGHSVYNDLKVLKLNHA
jgi:hypothetical protein